MQAARENQQEKQTDYSDSMGDAWIWMTNIHSKRRVISFMILKVG